ncbi:MAG: pyridoxamine 5'-phosphate oxidase family protein [Cytophagales bacterium]|nr:pyridoxamine 5'-phosphate oxidase family protein [Cytophagales bacterium]
MKNHILFFCGLLLAPPAPAQTRDEVLAAARDIITHTTTCALITQDSQGISRVRTMDPFAPEADFTVWLATNPKSRKVEELRKNPRVTLYYSDKQDQGYVTIHGTARLVNDQREKDRRWKESWKEFYPNRSDAYLLIEVTPDRLEVINYRMGINGKKETWEPAAVVFERRR